MTLARQRCSPAARAMARAFEQNVGQARQSLLQVVDLVTVLGEDDKVCSCCMQRISRAAASVVQPLRPFPCRHSSTPLFATAPLMRIQQLQAYHEIMKSLGQLNHEIAAHKDVVTRFSQTYKPTLKTTAFGDVLDEKLQARLQQQP